MISLLQAVLTDRPSDNFSPLDINIRTNYKNKTTIYKGRQQTEHRQQIFILSSLQRPNSKYLSRHCCLPITIYHA